MVVWFLTWVCCLFKLGISDACYPLWCYREETERLIEIMRSRTPDLSFEDQRAPGSTAKGFETTPFSTPAKLIDPQSSWGTDVLPSSNVSVSQLRNSLVIISTVCTCCLVAFVISMECEFCLYAFEVQLCLYLSNSFLKYATIFKIHCDSNIFNLFFCVLTDCESVHDHNLCTVLK